MTTRGEADFLKLPWPAAYLYDMLSKGVSLRRQNQDIASDLCRNIQEGRLLDLGTGPGRLLLEVHRLNPKIQSIGLDLSQAMFLKAKASLEGRPVELILANVCSCPCADECLDLVTCTGSLYLWDDPKQSLNEVYRILKAGRAAILYETTRDYKARAFRKALDKNLQREGVIRRVLTPIFLRKQLHMTYTPEEVSAIVRQTPFERSFLIERVTLGGLPIWMRITLSKPERVGDIGNRIF